MRPNTLFLTHEGVDVFRCFESSAGDEIILKDFWFATTQHGARFDLANNSQFDVRDMAGKPNVFFDNPENVRATIVRAIDEGVLTREGPIEETKCFCVGVSFRGINNFLVDARTPAEAGRMAKEMFDAGFEPTEVGNEEGIFEAVLSCEEWAG